MYCPKCGSPNEDHARFCERCGEVLANQSQTFTYPTTNRFGGFWIRFVAYFIDGLVLSIPLYFIEAVFGVFTIASAANTDSAAAGAGIILSVLFAWLMSAVVAWLYFSLMESSKTQGTLGKMALGLKVVDENGYRVSFGRATGRFFSKIVSGLILDIGYMMAGWTREKRALHDFMAGTFVVKKNTY